MNAGDHFEQTCDLLFAQVSGMPGFEDAALATPRVESMAPPISAGGGERRLIVGTIGFGGAAIKGAFTMAATAQVWDSLAPIEMRANDPMSKLPTGLLCDMVGELCNMVVGRFRNELLRRGIEVGCATPTTAQCAIGELHTSGSVKHSEWSTFTCPTGKVHVRVDASFGDGFSLAVVPSKSVEPAVDDLFFF